MSGYNIVDQVRLNNISSPHGSFIISDANFNALIGKDTKSKGKKWIKFTKNSPQPPSIRNEEIVFFSLFLSTGRCAWWILTSLTKHSICCRGFFPEKKPRWTFPFLAGDSNCCALCSEWIQCVRCNEIPLMDLVLAAR